MPKVFVTDASRRKAVPVIRSLGVKGIKVVAGDSIHWSIGFFSKYCSQRVVYRAPYENPDFFIEWLISYLKHNNCDVLFPIEDETLDYIAKHLNELSRYTAVPIADYATYIKARDKEQTMRLAVENGIPCPKTYFIKAIEELKIFINDLRCPVIIKPRFSSGSRGTVYVDKTDEIYSNYIEVHSKYPFPIIQEYIPGSGETYGVEALFNRNSEPRAVFVHRRIREYPLSGGPSTLREGVYKPDIAELGIKVLKALNWYGVAMVEFKVDPRDNIPKLIEVNPRFWGSLELAIRSGIDFPYLLYKMAVDGEIEPIKEYKIGIKCRWILGDILNFICNPNRLRMQPSFFKFFEKELYYDIFSKDDIAPAFGLVLFYLRKIFNKEFWKKYIWRK